MRVRLSPIKSTHRAFAAMKRPEQTDDDRTRCNFRSFTEDFRLRLHAHYAIQASTFISMARI